MTEPNLRGSLERTRNVLMGTDGMPSIEYRATAIAACVHWLEQLEGPAIEPEQGCAWLLWGRHPDRGSMPLGCYRTRQVALDAEELHKAHENADEWDDIWVVPWPLASEPRVNFRMKYSSRPLDAEEPAEAGSRTTDQPDG